MQATVRPSGPVSGSAELPGDKSIAHRLLILAATARGSSRIDGLPAGLDVMATARVLAAVAPSASSGLESWLGRVEVDAPTPGDGGDGDHPEVRVEGDGREGLSPGPRDLDCANSGTTIRLMSGVLAGAPFRSTLLGDESLRRRPMERVARPLRAMGAKVSTTNGRAPLEITGGPLRGIEWSTDVPSAQVKGAVLLAGLVAKGRTEVRESAPTRDHTERLLESLGASVERVERGVAVHAFQHGGFEATVPGDVSSAVFLIAAAAVTGGSVTIRDVGLNPTRVAFLDVVRRMGVETSAETLRTSLGEPIGRLEASATDLHGTHVSADELTLVIDEVPALAAIAAHANGETRFEGAAELRLKESDRLTALAEGLCELGGDARVEGDALVIAGGGLDGGSTNAREDHRLAMAFTVAAFAARHRSHVEGIEAADVSFPGFVALMKSLRADVEVLPK
jgi:3-phosphoshikimate 1-carboxyvinyltransferase